MAPSGGRNPLMDLIYRIFEKDSGIMVLITSALGIGLSAFAQSLFISTNKKYTPAQKAFMIPQEFTECAISIGTMVFTTLCIRKVASKFIDSGKILSKDIAEYLKKNNLEERRGTSDFNVSKSIEDIIENIKKTDKFVKSSEADKNNILAEHVDALNKFGVIKDSSLAYVTTGGSIISTALIVPFFRNWVAAEFQKKRLESEKLENKESVRKEPVEKNPSMKGRFVNYSTSVNRYYNLFNI